MSATGTEVTLAILGVWRIAHLLHAENGPGDVVVKLRRALGTSVFGRAMDCFDCLSVWVAMPFAALAGDAWREMALLWPALSAAAMIVNRGVLLLRPPAAALYVEDPPEEIAHVQLRQGARERGDAGIQSGSEDGSGGHAAAIAARTVVDHRV
jgi:hypothetical protein